MANDTANVDPKHYTVDFENDSVRVLRIGKEVDDAWASQKRGGVSH